MVNSRSVAPIAGYRRSIRAAARRLAIDLHDDPNVSHVSTGRKEVDGGSVDRLAIKIHVINKRRWGRGGELVEHRGGRFPTDIVEVGERPKLTGFGGGDQLLAFDRDIGINGLAFTKSGRTYLLTNAHVVSDVARNGLTGPVSAYNGSVAASVRLGDVAYLSTLSADRIVTEDAAAVTVDHPATVDPYRISYNGHTVSRDGMIQPQWGPYWFASAGELFTCDGAEPIDGPTPIEVDGVDLTYSRFWQLRMTDGLMRKGLSGSLLCRQVGDDTVACGLVFGQSSEDYAWVFQFVPLFKNVRAHLP